VTGQAAGAGHYCPGRTSSALARLLDLQGRTHVIPIGSVAQDVTVYDCTAVTGIHSESNPPSLDQLRLWPPGLGESLGMSMAPAKGNVSGGAMAPISRAMSQSRSKPTYPWNKTVGIGVQAGPATRTGGTGANGRLTLD
jgi:hypothetical protein